MEIHKRFILLRVHIGIHKTIWILTEYKTSTGMLQSGPKAFSNKTSKYKKKLISLILNSIQVENAIFLLCSWNYFFQMLKENILAIKKCIYQRNYRFTLAGGNVQLVQSLLKFCWHRWETNFIIISMKFQKLFVSVSHSTFTKDFYACGFYTFCESLYAQIKLETFDPVSKLRLISRRKTTFL